MNTMNNNNLLKLEALLFAYGRFVKEEELNIVLNFKNLKPLLKELKTKYETDETSLNLIQNEDSWKFTVKDNYLDLVKGIVTKTELDRPTMETLAVIAFKYPVLQSDVIKTRGGSAYEHIKNLMEHGYVLKEKLGRSFKLKLTQKFFDYFDLPEKKVKEFFSEYKEIEEEIVKKEEEGKAIKNEIDKEQKILEDGKDNQKLTDFKTENTE